MDLSKLPKMSQTPVSPPPPAEPPPAPPPQVVPVVLTPSLADAWFSIAIGVIVLFVFPHTIQYLHSPTTFEQNNPVTDGAGNTIPYLQSNFFLPDLGMTVFGIVLVVEGIAQIVALRRPVVLSVLALTVGAGLFNLFVVVSCYNKSGFQLFCALAVAISGYMALSQWTVAKILGMKAR